MPLVLAVPRGASASAAPPHSVSHFLHYTLDRWGMGQRLPVATVRLVVFAQPKPDS